MQTIPLEPASKHATVQRPGDFRRRGEDGPPYVASLTKTRQPKGNRPELVEQCIARGIEHEGRTVPELRAALGPEPAWELYGRPSGYGDEIENQYNLMKWSERQIVAGIAAEPEVLRLLDESDDRREALDRIANQAHEVAGSNVARDRGTFLHRVTEWADEVGL